MSEAQVKACARLFNGDAAGLARLAAHGRLRDAPVRSLAWRFFLGALPSDVTGWVARARRDADEYVALCKQARPARRRTRARPTPSA